MNREELYALSRKKVLRGELPRELCLYSPREVYNALIRNNFIKKWHMFISKQYYPPPGKKVLLLYPCSTVKPYYMSRSYVTLFRTLKSLGRSIRQLIHVVTISEPFGLIPEEYYDKKHVWYDCPGLFEWWCKKMGQPYEEEYVEKSINILSECVACFLKGTYEHYKIRIAFVRTFSSGLRVRKDYIHRRIVEKASALANIHVELLPPIEIVKLIVTRRGARAWDFYGVAHPIAQEYLKRFLLKRISQYNLGGTKNVL